ncbi:MAG: hypothetical protein CFE24_14955 [Flavobacterium sp. BFFFF2]|nr:MAG: hypothetical protein CFE24_14955 [Flavobacterium sp. BFFFF2]
MNKVIGIAIAGTIAYGIIKLLKMQQVSDSTTLSLVNPRLHQISLNGISFRTEVSINNTSKDSVTITKPVVFVSSGGKPIAQSNAENKLIVIQPLNQTKIDTIELQIGWPIMASLGSSLISKIPTLVSIFRSGNLNNIASQLGIPIEMSFTTYVNGLYYKSEVKKIIG